MSGRSNRLALGAVTAWCAAVLLACSGDSTDFFPADSADFSSEGTLNSPIDLGAAPVTQSGTVAAAGSSYFSSTADAGTWLVGVSNIDGDPDLFLYSDSAYTSLVASSENPGADPESSTVDCSAPCDIYIRIFGAGDRGASFTIAIAQSVQ